MSSLNRGAVPVPTFAVLHGAKHGDANVLVAKSVAQVVARQDGSEQQFRREHAADEQRVRHGDVAQRGLIARQR